MHVTKQMRHVPHIPKPTKDVHHLMSEVAKQSSGVSVRLGETNGEPVLHLIHRKQRRSVTIPATHADWANHPWNKYNKPKKEGDDQ